MNTINEKQNSPLGLIEEYTLHPKLQSQNIKESDCKTKEHYDSNTRP